MFSPIVTVHRSVARRLADPEFLAAMNEDSRVDVTAEEFPELLMSPDEFEHWANQHKRDVAGKGKKERS